MINVPPSTPSSGAYVVPKSPSSVVAALGGGPLLPVVGGALPAAVPPGLDEGVPVPHAATTIVAAARSPASRWRIGTSRCLVPVPDDGLFGRHGRVRWPPVRPMRIVGRAATELGGPAGLRRYGPAHRPLREGPHVGESVDVPAARDRCPADTRALTSGATGQLAATRTPASLRRAMQPVAGSEFAALFARPVRLLPWTTGTGRLPGSRRGARLDRDGRSRPRALDRGRARRGSRRGIRAQFRRPPPPGRRRSRSSSDPRSLRRPECRRPPA